MVQYHGHPDPGCYVPGLLHGEGKGGGGYIKDTIYRLKSEWLSESEAQDQGGCDINHSWHVMNLSNEIMKATHGDHAEVYW